MLKPQCTQKTLRKVSDEAPSAGEWLLRGDGTEGQEAQDDREFGGSGHPGLRLK